MAFFYNMQYGTHQLTIHSLCPRVPGGPQGDECKDKNSLTLHTTTDVYQHRLHGIYLLYYSITSVYITEYLTSHYIIYGGV